MAVEIMVKNELVDELRRKLDPMCADHPPKVSSDEKVPNATFLTYSNVQGEAYFAACAMQLGASSVRKL
ncbi:MAG TPA: hypothetical protein VNM40_01105 [Candidatus Paceibacterota bacterium]|nr:hypothetical protein [Candidatus Paceibacterota bacterium]